jgi:hypothetical protein
MKNVSILCFCMGLVFTACKKNKDSDPAPAPLQNEQLTPADGKKIHFLFHGNTRDTSGNSYHGREATGLSYTSDRFNRADNAISFNGTNSQFESKGMSVSFPFALSFWMKTPTPAATATLFKSDRNSSDPGMYSGFWFQTLNDAPNTMAFNFGDATGYSSSARNSLISTKTLTADQWHHIAINATGANNMELYINGVKDNTAVYSGSATSIVYQFANPTATIGMGFNNQLFNGSLDDFRLYSRLLTATEIASLYNFTP